MSNKYFLVFLAFLFSVSVYSQPVSYTHLLAAMVGGIGIAPGANINYQTGHAIFEATHGTCLLYTSRCV